MERRSVERLPARLQARLFYGNMIYSGIVANLSEKGMFICTRINFPIDSVFVVIVLRNGQTFKFPVKVRRFTKSNNNHYGCIEESGIGVELLNTPQDYLEFINKCKFSGESILKD
ncbi:MAG: PilZ domain-containing protein [Nitrospirae bacterium]|nr:PilZ domain-containing protein [Nitrospirota bacterium]